MPPAFLPPLGHGCVLMDHRAVPGGRRGQPGHEAAHMHHGALLREHRAMERVGADLAHELGPAQHGRVGIGLAMQHLEVAGERGDVLRLGGELELARPPEGAVDALLGDDPLDRIDGIVESLVEGHRAFAAQRGLGRDEAMSEAVVEMAAIAARGSVADAFRLQHHDLRAGHGELARGGETGEATADDGHVVRAFDRPPGGAGETAGRVMPIGFELHRPGPQSPNTPGRPEMSLISV